ncbi:MAG: BACON domain-containing protein [Desulfobulbaceae bacterium]
MTQLLMDKTNVWRLLLLVLAGIFTSCTPAQAATMAAFHALPSLDAGVDKPTAVAVDAVGRVYVAESMSNRVRVFAQGGGLLAELTGLSKPISVAVDGAGRLYVGSAWQGSVTVYDQDRRELFKLGGGDNEFIEPADIDLDESGRIYVTDKGGNTIRVYDAAGRYLRSIGTPATTPPAANGQLWHPSSLAIDPASLELVVLDQQQLWDNYARTWIDGARIQFFSMAGEFLRGYSKFGYDLDAGQLIKPAGVAVDALSRVYVSDARLQKVMVYDNVNTFLGMVDNNAAPLRTPLGLAMAGTGRLYVAALLAGRVDVFGIDAYAALAVQPASLSFTATEGDDLPAPQEAVIMNSGKSELTWSAATGSDWLSLPAAGGTLAPGASGPVAVAVRHDGLAPGSHQGSVRVSAPGMEELVAVTLTVKPNPLQVSPLALSFFAGEGTTPAAQLLSVTTGGAEPVAWSAAVDQAWLFLNKNTGNGSDTVKVYADTSGLGLGEHHGALTFQNLAGGRSVVVGVSLHISESAEPPSETPALPQVDGKGVQAADKIWRTRRPAAGVTLRGVWGANDRDALVVGDNGTILRFDGKSWRPMSSGSRAMLRSIWGVTAENSYDAYAVGAGGTVLHFDGATWAPVDSGTGEPLADVWVASEVLVVSDYGTFLNLSRGEAASTGLLLRTLWGGSESDLFAAGESGMIGRFDGTAWTAMESDTSQWLNGLWGYANGEVFAVGENGAIVRYDGTAWTGMDSGSYETLRGVYGTAPDDIYAVGDNGTVLRYDGTAWTALFTGGVDLRAVWADGTLVVAVGEDGTVLTGQGRAPRTAPGRKPKAVLRGSEAAPESATKVDPGAVRQAPMLKGPREIR